jgi:hypothetical protein
MTSASPLERPDPPSRTTSHRDSPALRTDRPKTHLFCPCGREAPADEWETEAEGQCRLLVCPDCGETLTVR